MRSNLLRTRESWLAVAAFTLLLVFAQSSLGQEMVCDETGRICKLRQAIRAGAEVDTDRQRVMGLVTVAGGCSGTLLNDFWVLTARHCVTAGNVVSGPLLAPSRVAITATWAPGRSVAATRIYDFKVNSTPDSRRDRDIVLIYLGATNFGEVNRQPIYSVAVRDGGGSVRLSGKLKTEDLVTQYGIGFSSFASGTVGGNPPAMPATGLGTYRSSQFRPSNIDETHYTLVMNSSSQVGHGGDSGGPTWVTEGGYGVGIAGVQSTCVPTGYVAMQPRVWMWATGISSCNYVSTAPFLGEISDTIRETPQGGAATRIASVTNDFNADGFADILWYNSSTGEPQVWHLNGPSRVGRTTVTANGSPVSIGPPSYSGPPWRIAGSRDFDGDGDTDLLWYNSSNGETKIWYMSRAALRTAGTVVDEAGKPIYIGPPFSIVGTNYDTKPQIIWYNSQTGEIQLWRMNNNRISNRLVVHLEDGRQAFVGPPFSIVGSGDFNGDARDDLVWHHANTGEIRIWMMNDGRVTVQRNVVRQDGSSFGAVAPWSVVGTNDFNRDGMADILWHHGNTGETQIFYMDGHRIRSWDTVEASRDGGGHLVGAPWSILRH